MNRQSPAVHLSRVLGAAVCLALLAGCEDEPSTRGVGDYFENSGSNPGQNQPAPGNNVRSGGSLRINPATAAAGSSGQSFAFRAYGGAGPYRWSVSNARAGAVTQDRTGSDSAIYRCAEVAPNTIMVVDSRGRSATVAITVPTTAQALAIIPSSHTLTAAETTGLPLSIHGDTVQFHAVGGVPPYGPWRAASPSLGTINAAGVYTVNGTSGLGQNTVSITDSAGHVATATVTTKLNQ